MCFFKQRTAYEMRISDWSSDVCSSDLIDGPEGDQPYRALQQNEQTAEAECQGERPQQAGTQLGAVAGAVGLGGEAGRAHAQKAEAPEQEAEDDAAHGHAADEAGVRQVADSRRIDRAEQRRGQVGQDDRPGELPDTAVRSEEHTSELQSIMRI